ncbi:MAG: SRPBCC domain-containing protein [Hyphomonadaceae bacterium]
MADGQASAEKSTFKQSVKVSNEIAAPRERVWALLTDAEVFPRWNSTVTSIEGPIALGRKLAVRVPISPRVFKPKVSVFEPSRRMVWQDGAAPMFRGVRVYELEPAGAGTRFVMTETFSGLMLPMIAASLPDFVPVFTRYAADLKRAAEANP